MALQVSAARIHPLCSPSAAGFEQIGAIVLFRVIVGCISSCQETRRGGRLMEGQRRHPATADLISALRTAT